MADGASYDDGTPHSTPGWFVYDSETVRERL